MALAREKAYDDIVTLFLSQQGGPVQNTSMRKRPGSKQIEVSFKGKVDQSYVHRAC